MPPLTFIRGSPANPHHVIQNITKTIGRLIQKRYGQLMNWTMMPP